jgi:ubiquitin carboxyl-terminal hydrolase 5/13
MDEPEEFWFQMPEAPPAAAPAKEYGPDDAGEHAAALAPLLGMAKKPAAEDAVHKEECAWSFARPTSETGLNVSLTSFLGVGGAFLDFHRQKTGDRLYLNITSRRKPTEKQPEGEEHKSVADAINAAAAADKKDYDTAYKLVALLDDAVKEIPLELDDDNNVTAPVLPGSVQASIEALLQHKDMGNAADLEAFKDELRETKWHAALPLEDNGVKISPKRADWKCSKTGDVLADKTGPGTSASLWVNLSDGFIGGGRKNFDGSGGNNTALDH